MPAVQLSSLDEVARVLRRMSYSTLRDLAGELATAATQRADPKEELGGFDIEDRVDWAELLADWADAH